MGIEEIYKEVLEDANIKYPLRIMGAGALLGGLYGDGTLLGKQEKAKGMTDAEYKRILRKARITGAIRGATILGNPGMLSGLQAREMLRPGGGSGPVPQVIGGALSLAQLLAGVSRIKDDAYVDLIHGKRFKRQAESPWSAIKTEDEAKKIYKQEIVGYDTMQALANAALKTTIRPGVESANRLNQLMPGFGGDFLEALRNISTKPSPKSLEPFFGKNPYVTVKDMSAAEFKKLFRK